MNDDRQQDGGYSAPQEEQQGFVEGGYEPEDSYESGYEPGYGPAGGYDSESGYGPEGGYDPESSYESEGNYEPEADYDPAGGYYPEDSYGPEGGYEPEGGYDPAGGYYPEDGYGPEGGYESEGGYDPAGGYYPEDGYGPEGGYDPGSESEGGYGYEPEGGYDPEFNDVVDEEPMDAPAADPSGGTPSPEHVEQAGDDTKDPEIEMPPEYVGRDAGEDEEIEMSPEGGGQAGTDAGVDGKAPETPPDDAGQAGADTEDGEIEMPPMYVGRDADSGEGEIEMPPMYVGRDDGDGEVETPPEDGGGVKIGYPRLVTEDEAHEKELAELDTYEKLEGYVREIHRGLYEGSDPGLVEALNDLDISASEHLDTYDELKAAAKTLLERRDRQEDEQAPDDVGQTGADPGDDEIEMPPMYMGRTGHDAAHNEELAKFDSYEGLAGYYKELNNDLYERFPDLAEAMNKQQESGEDLDTYHELKAATKSLLEQRDLRDAHHQGLEGRYGDDISGDPGLQTYDQLADYYKNLSMVLSGRDQEPDVTGLDTVEKLKVGVYELWEQRDQYLKQHEGEQHLEEKDESHTNDSGNNAPEIEMPPEYVGRAGADAGDEEIEMPPMDVGRADAGGGKIETPPNDAGKAGADAGDEEIEMTGNEEIEITPDGEVKMIGETVGGVHIGYPREVSQAEGHEKELEGLDTHEDLGAYYKELFHSLYDRYPDMINETNMLDLTNPDLDSYEELKAQTIKLLEERDSQEDRKAQLEARYDNVSDDNHPRFAFTSEEYLTDYYKTLYKQLNGSDQEPSMAGLDTYERLRLGVYELWEQRDKIFEKYDRERETQEKNESHTDDPGENGADQNYKFFFGTEDSDQAAPQKHHHEAGHDDAAEDVGDPYGYGDYFGW